MNVRAATMQHGSPLGARLQPIEFVPLDKAPTQTWARPSYGFVAAMSQVPIADTEMLLAAHYLPIALDNIQDEPRVVALTSPRFQKLPIISKTGKWLRGYMPIALRCLPFRCGPRSCLAELEIATNLRDGPGARLPLFTSEGSPAPEVQKVQALLARLETGKVALRSAAERLLMADVIAPFHLARIPEGHTARRQFFTVDRTRFAALSASRAALLVADGFLPIDLAAACIFSQRLMATLIEFVGFPAGPSADNRPRIFDAFSLVDQIDVGLDDSELFSFDRFTKNGRTEIEA